MERISINKDDILVRANSVSVCDGKKFKVLLVVRWPVGGIRTFLKYLVTFFPSDHYEFSVIGTSTEGMAALKADFGEFVANWELIPADGNEMRNFLSAVWNLDRRHRFDLIHAHGFTSVISCLAAALATSRPLVCTSHDVLNNQQFSGISGRIKKIILGAALLRCKLVHSVSRDAETNLLNHFPVINHKSLVVKNGVDTSSFSTAVRTDLHETFSIDPSARLIGFFGRFMGQKGFKYLISAIEIIQSREGHPSLHVVCFGSGAFIREEQAEIKRRGLDRCFTFAPFMADVSGAMKGCDIIAMPSLWEACPLQPMEALCAGVPFVGTNCIGLREVLDGTPAVVVEAADAESLAKGILNALDQGREAFEKFVPKATERFDARKTAQGVYEMYEKVLR
ncbi:glycosyltransferase family 4 protein [Marinobacter alexandrii]|uniref:glycosyltransferase family 4 protein n=1 Tax=Marinobacter alexandrii TaxID=2570351 RepID=UPI0032675BE5